MEKASDNLRERLLARMPQPGNLAAYQAEVEASLEKNQRGLRRERKVVTVLWVFVVCLSTVFLIMSGQHLDTQKGLYAAILACFVLIYPSAEVLKHFINRARVDVLKEVKQVQLQVLELQASILKDRER